jgi:hypothetical protein
MIGFWNAPGMAAEIADRVGEILDLVKWRMRSWRQYSLRTKVFFKGRRPSIEMTFEGETVWKQALEKTLQQLDSEQHEEVTAIYVFLEDSEEPVKVVFEESSPH